MGMSAIRLVDTVSIPGALQRAINAQSTSHILPLATLTYTNTFTIGGLMQTFGTATTEFLAYNSTIQNKGYNVRYRRFVPPRCQWFPVYAGR